MGGDIHDAEQLPCLLNHSAGEQSEETALVPLGGLSPRLRATTTFRLWNAY